jgi:signal peptidase II
MQERGLVAALTRPRVLAFTTAAVVVVVDLLTTSIAVADLHAVRHLWGPFGLALTFNSGFAFSLFSGRATLITVVLCFGVVGLAWVVARARTVPMALGAGLILGGAVGNVAERIVGGHGGQVPDYITLDYWPTFNVADACVTVGVVMVIVTLLFGHIEEEQKDQAHE